MMEKDSLFLGKVFITKWAKQGPQFSVSEERACQASLVFGVNLREH